MPYFPPENWAEATIVVGYILAAIMYVLIPVVIPAGYGVRAVYRKAKTRLDARNARIVAEREARQ